MKIIPIILITICFNLYTSNAEAKHQPRADDINWSEELNLNKHEQERIDAIYAQSHDRVLSLMQQIETLNKEIANIRESNEAKIRETLNDKQKVKFDKIKERMNKNNPNKERAKGKKKPSRKRMRQY